MGAAPAGTLAGPPMPSGGEADAALERYLDIAARENPGVRAARYEWLAATAEARQAGALADPMLTYGYFLQEVETRVGPQKHRVSVSQSLPWFGTLGLRGEAAEAGAEAARQRYRDALLSLGREVAAAYADYFELGRTIDITRDNLELLRYWEQVLTSRYAAGGAKYADLIKAQVELGRIENRLSTLLEQRLPKAARLTNLLGRDLDGDMGAPDVLPPWPSELPEVRLFGGAAEQEDERVALQGGARPGDGAGDPHDPQEPVFRGSAGLVDSVRRDNPDLAALRAQVERADATIDLRRKRYWPDLTIGVDWIQIDAGGMPGTVDDGKDPVIAMVGVRLPLWRGAIAAGVEQAQAQRAAAAARLEDRRLSLESRATELAWQSDDAVRRIALYGDALIPKAQQSMDAAFRAYEAGTADFLLVLDAQRQLLEFETNLAQAQAARLRSVAALRTLAGQAPIGGSFMEDSFSGED